MNTDRKNPKRIDLTPEQARQVSAAHGDIVPSNVPELAGRAPKGPQCPHCGAEMPFIGFLIGETLCLTERTLECTCPAAMAESEAKAAMQQREKEEREAREKAERIAAMQKRAGMGAREQEKTFAGLEHTPDNFSAITQAQAYAKAYINRTRTQKPSLYICGDLGTGKTHLAAAMANEIISAGRAVKYTTFARMTQDVRTAYYSASKETEAETVKRYQDAPILFLDDLGKEKPTEWNLALLFSLIDYRYSNGLPTVITANYTLEEIGEKLTPIGGDPMTAAAIVDRLFEDCHQLQINGQSWRRR